MSDGPVGPLDVQRVDGYGVPAFWLPHDGELTAGLILRSGRGREPLALSGITHLTLHLVLDEMGIAPHSSWSYSDLDVVGQAFTGDPALVKAYLETFSALLSVPPVENLTDAIAALQAEGESFAPRTRERLLRLRHGATGPGALSFEEYATRKAGHKQVQNWSSRYLHNANAALWISGPSIDGLRLRLVNGVPVKINPPLLAVPTPGAAYGAPGEVGLSMMGLRSHAFGAAMQIVERRASHELITRRRAASAVQFDINRHGGDLLELVATVTCATERDDECLRTLLWLFEDLAYNPPTIEEIDNYRNEIASVFFRPELHAFRAREMAIDYLTDASPSTWEATYAELDALNPIQISSTITESLSTVLAVAARDCRVLEERFTYVGAWNPSLAQGANFRAIPVPGEGTPDRELIVGKAGLTLREGDHVSSVHFGHCALMIRSDDGYRELIDESGSRLVIIASAWERSEFLLNLIDSENVPERTIVIDDTRDIRGGYVGAERRRWYR